MTDMKIDGGPAFPVSTSSKGNDVSGPYGHQDGRITWQFPGMTLRDYFAAKAIQAFIPDREIDIEEICKACAVASYKIADLMLEARDRD